MQTLFSSVSARACLVLHVSDRHLIFGNSEHLTVAYNFLLFDNKIAYYGMFSCTSYSAAICIAQEALYHENLYPYPENKQAGDPQGLSESQG